MGFQVGLFVPKRLKGMNANLAFCGSCMKAYREARGTDSSVQTSVKTKKSTSSSDRQSNTPNRGNKENEECQGVLYGNVQTENILIDPLSFMVFGLQSGTGDNVKNAIWGPFF